MVFDLKCKVSIDYGDGKDFTAATIIFKNDEGKHIILSSITDTTAVGEEIIKELSNMGKLAAKNSHQSNKKKVGDLTLREVVNMKCYGCDSCIFYNKKYDDIFADRCCDLVSISDEFNLLEKEIEVEENE